MEAVAVTVGAEEMRAASPAGARVARARAAARAVVRAAVRAAAMAGVRAAGAGGKAQHEMRRLCYREAMGPPP